MTTLFNVTDFGATGDGTTLDSPAVNKAIDAAAVNGGTVLLPAGTYLCGSIHLKSRVTLHIDHGATLLGSPNLEHYSKQTWGHHDDRTPWHLIFAEDAEHIAITGQGTINGNGEHFKESTRKDDWSFYRETPMRPSPMIEISRCVNVRIENVFITQPGGWNLHLHDCDRAFIRGITIKNSLFWPNSDGIDLTGCHDTMISDCFISTGDDAIALKTTIDSRSCEHITVTNCVLETACAAIRLGFESDQDFRNCSFSNITIKNCSRGIDLLTFAGGNIENCSFSNIVGRCMSGWCLDRPIEISTGFTNQPYKCTIPEHPNCGMVYPDRPAGNIRGITITNFDMETCGRIMMGATKDGVAEDITLDHIRLRYPMIDDCMPLGERAGGKSFYPDMPELRCARAAIVCDNIQDLRIRDYRVHWPTYPINPENVELLRSPNRNGNPEYYNDLDKVISGENAPAYHAFWAKNTTGHIETFGVKASTPAIDPITLDGGDMQLI